MAFRTALLVFKKPSNSTARPYSWPLEAEFSGEIKGDFTPTAFDMTFAFDDPTVNPIYNYAYVAPFKRYYFVSQWAFEGGLWTARFITDLLATYASEAGENYAYILRAESDYDPYIIDNMYMQRGATITDFRTLSPTNFWQNEVENGCIVAGIVGNSGRNIGAVTYYAIPYSVFNSFMSAMLSSINWAGISVSEISEELQKALINPVQYIVSCVWLPFALSQFSGDYTSNVKLGWWSFSIGTNSAIIVSRPSSVLRRSFVMSLPKHPQAESNDRLRFLRLAPYTSYVFKFLPFGVFELDTSKLIDYDAITVAVRCNAMTGDAVMDVYAGPDVREGASLLTAQCNVGVQIPTGQIAANLANMNQAITAGMVTGAADLIAALRGGGYGDGSGAGGGGKTLPGLGGGRK